MLSHDDDAMEALLATLTLAEVEAAAETDDRSADVETDEERLWLAALLADLEEASDKVATPSAQAAGALAAPNAPAPAGFPWLRLLPLKRKV